MTKRQLYIGLMSGTSADGIDLALVDFSSDTPTLVAKYYQAYSDTIRQSIMALYQPGNNEIDRAFALDMELAKLFSDAIFDFLCRERLDKKDILAIGNHGQTLRHRPTGDNPFTLQIGCCQALATLTGIRVIGQFRRKDMALGGQGAPLVPAFHQAMFAEADTDVFIVNIGGIANISYLPANQSQQVQGFDTGPGNALMDDWFQKHHQGPYDTNGQWAASGKVNPQLLKRFLTDSYFTQAAPKSTGREVFHLDWLEQHIKGFDLPAADIQASLCALTAETIAREINKLSRRGKVYLCGGGAHNETLNSLINQILNGHTLAKLSQKEIDIDALEAMAFAWLAYAFDKKIPGNIPAVTGARKEAILGNVSFP